MLEDGQLPCTILPPPKERVHWDWLASRPLVHCEDQCQAPFLGLGQLESRVIQVFDDLQTREAVSGSLRFGPNLPRETGRAPDP